MSPSLAIIGGSAAYHLLKKNNLGDEKDCRTLTTPFGKSAPVHLFSTPDTNFWFLSRHGEDDYSITAPFVNYRANIYALKELGVERILSWSGPGIINTAFKPGEIIIPDDILDETKNREGTFFKHRGHGFIRQKEPFCPEIRGFLQDACERSKIPYHKNGVYACTEGPRLETPAEIRKLKVLGADLVGMTLAPETFLARELEICYASFCYLTNYAEGVVNRDFASGQLFEGMQNFDEKKQVDAILSQFPGLLLTSLNFIQHEKRDCHCGQSMRRYRDKKMIDDNWKNWIGPL